MHADIKLKYLCTARSGRDLVINILSLTHHHCLEVHYLEVLEVFAIQLISQQYLRSLWSQPSRHWKS